MGKHKKVIFVSVITLCLVAFGIIMMVFAKPYPGFEWGDLFFKNSYVYITGFMLITPLVTIHIKNVIHTSMIALGLLFFISGTLFAANMVLDSSQPVELCYKVKEKGKKFVSKGNNDGRWQFYLKSYCDVAEIKTVNFHQEFYISKDQWNSVTEDGSYYVLIEQYRGTLGIKHWVCRGLKKSSEI